MCGNDTAYLVDRCYGHPASRIGKEFGTPESLYRQNLYGGKEWSGAMDDSRHAHPKNLYIWLHSLGLPGGYGNGVIHTYDFWNKGSAALDSMYAGIWADFDLSASGALDRAYTDTVRRMAYIRQASNVNPHCGLVLLAPKQASNVSIIKNPIWVYPTDTCVTKAQKLRMLNGKIHLDAADTTTDYSLLVATGPFDLPPGGRHVMSFAIVAGTSLDELNNKVDSLQAWYDANTGLMDHGPNIAVPTALSLEPNPVTGLTHITFGAAAQSEARLVLYDRAGRCVEQLWSGRLNGRTMSLAWNAGAKLRNGVYFLRLEGDRLDCTAKAIIAR